MTDSVRDVLEAAAGTGELIRIVYHGGSQPGSVREITPLTVSETETIAMDDSGVRKTFKLAKIEIANPAASYPAYDAALSPEPEDTRPVGVVLAAAVGELEDKGWRVEVSQDCVSLFRRFSDGTPEKNTSLQLYFTEFTCEIFMELDGSESQRRSALPYHVHSCRLGRTVSFQKSSRALEAFWAEARAISPIAPPKALRKSRMPPDVTVAICPSCQAVLEHVPRQRTICPKCQQPIVVRRGHFYTEDEARAVDACAKISVTPEQLLVARGELSRKTGRPVPASDAAWELMGEAARREKPPGRRMIYFAMARLLWELGRDHRDMLLKSHNSELAGWCERDEDATGIQVEIITAGEKSCPACRALEGVTLTLSEARKKKLLPAAGCTNGVDEAHPLGWCRCMYGAT
jgi:hypothetical protein